MFRNTIVFSLVLVCCVFGSTDGFAVDDAVIDGWFGVACDLAGRSESEREKAIQQIIVNAGNHEQFFIEKLHSEKTVERQVGAKILGEIGRKRAELELIAALDSEDVFLQKAAARALARFYAVNEQAVLLGRLQETDKYFVNMAVLYGAYYKARYAAEKPSAAMIAEVVRILETSQDNTEIIAAIMLLRYAESEEAVLGLIRLLKISRNMFVQIEVCKALASLAPLGEVKEVEELASCGVPEIEVEALGALAAMGYKDVAKALLVLVTYPDPAVQVRALEVLGGIVDRSYADVFSAALKSEYAGVRLAALQVLAQMNAFEAGKSIALMMGRNGDRDPVVRAYAALVFNKLNHSGGVVQLLEDARSNDPQMLEFKLEAIKALGVLQDKTSLRALLELLSDGEYEVRMAAITALGQLGDSRAVSMVKKRLETAQGNELLALTELLEKLNTAQSNK